jgi:uncharacterized protein (DUF1697 family)
MTRQIVLLRGINVGSRRRVPMQRLRELLTELGYGDVSTFLQSGNVLLTSKHSGAQLEHKLERQIAAEFAPGIRIVVRTRAELAKVVTSDPLGDVATEPKRYQVSFLSAKLDPAIARELAAADVAPEQVVVSGREIYAWHPAGLQRSKLARLLTDKHLGVTATARNWNTVTKLLELAGG